MSPTAFLRRHAPRIRIASLAAIALALVLFARAAPLEPWLASLERWLAELGPAGFAAFVALYVAAALLLAPGSVLTAAAGALFGLALGTAAAWVGSVATAGLAFLIGRHLARDAVLQRARSVARFRALDAAIEQGGWRIVALLRLSPAIPFSLANYLFGVTGVRFWPYMLASAIAMLPGTFLYVYLGQVGAQGLAGGGERGPGGWALLAAGLLATAVAVVYITRLARRELHRKAPSAERRQPRPGNPWTALGTAAAALLALAAAGIAWVRRDDLRRWAEDRSPPAQAEEEPR